MNNFKNNYVETHSEKDMLIINYKEKGLKVFNPSGMDTLLNIVKKGITDDSTVYILLVKEVSVSDYNKSNNQIKENNNSNSYIDSLDFDSIYNWI